MRDDVVFTAGDACSSMYFIGTGAAYYGMDNQAKDSTMSGIRSSTLMKGFALAQPHPTLMFGPQKVSRGRWLSEAALWVVWTHVGSLRAISRAQVSIFALDVQK